ncbi:MAG: aminopeptidase P N-terminal domain-containing protein [Oceanococcaceae bacterium]
MPAPSLPSTEFSTRRARLAEAIGPQGVAVVFAAHECTRSRDTHFPFRQDSDFHYLSGFPEPDAVLVIAPGRAEGECVLFVRPKDREREIWDGYRAGPEGAVRDYQADQAFNLDDIGRRMPELLANREAVYHTMGLAPAHDAQLLEWLNGVRAQARNGVAAPTQITGLDAVLHPLRQIKSPDEVAMMRHAAEVSAAAHCRAMRASAPGVREYQLEAHIHHEFAMAGMAPAYGSIVGGGANACVLHYVENAAELQAGTLCLIDAGAEYQGYAADITRTFPVDGRFSEAQKEVYEVVLQAQLAAIEAVQVGADWLAPHRAATRVLTEGLVALGALQGEVDALIEEGAQTAFFMHKTGHWIGLDVHDVGSYRENGNWRKLEAGHALTIEPGLYFAPDNPLTPARYAGIGIRIEDDVVVTNDGPDVLTAGVPKTIADIEALMAR